MQSIPSEHEALDFDYWLSLAQDNPEQFEIERDQFINNTINRAPADHQPRLRSLQWRVDHERLRAKHPMAACVAISRQMWSSLHNLSDALHGRSMPRARVLSFPHPQAD